MNLLIVVVVFLLMEGVTWLLHKYVMHGFLWVLHSDHHDHSSEGPLERNDLFFVIFAIPAITLFYVGVAYEIYYLIYVAIGVTLYGMTYFIVHDVFIHQRAKVFSKTENPYLLAIRRAHKQHHKHVDKFDGECFGFL